MHRSPSITRTLARFNRRFANPVVRLVAGWLPPFAVLRHRGRRTGRLYATPVLAFGAEDGLVVAVLYGITSDWVRNLQRMRHVEVKRLGSVRVYSDQRLIDHDEALRLLPAIVRGPFRVLGVRDFVRLTGSAAGSGPTRA